MLLKISRIVVVAFLLGVTSCNHKTNSTDNSGGPGQVGIASWYGPGFQGKLTASGEPFDTDKMTAAHRTLPFGTMVRVHSLVTGKTADIRVNDRGPFVADRVIDLSHAAAQGISMQGVANVRLEILSTPPTRDADLFAVQIGAFPAKSDAERVANEMRKRYGAAQLVFRQGDQTWRVLVGLEPTIESANALAAKLEHDSSPALVVRFDSGP
jgi:rare lipoprotein A